MKEIRKKELIDYHLQQAQILVSKLEKEDKHNNMRLSLPGGLFGTPLKDYHINEILDMVRVKAKAQGVVIRR